jgi:hypothetical protein
MVDVDHYQRCVWLAVLRLIRGAPEILARLAGDY